MFVNISFLSVWAFIILAFHSDFLSVATLHLFLFCFLIVGNRYCCAVAMDTINLPRWRDDDARTKSNEILQITKIILF